MCRTTRTRVVRPARLSDKRRDLGGETNERIHGRNLLCSASWGTLKRMVRRSLAVVLLLLVLGVAALPAVAQQRDPFRPLVRPATETGAPAGTTTEPATTGAPTPARPALPQTGEDHFFWWQLGTVLVIVGSAVLALHRIRRLA